MNNGRLRDLQKEIINRWAFHSIMLKFDSEESFTNLYADYMAYSQANTFQVFSKKMFSILLREYLSEPIKSGSVQVKPSVKNIYKGISFRTFTKILK